MSDHLSNEQIVRYRGRIAPGDELMQVDGHLAECFNCRERIAPRHELDLALAPRTVMICAEADHLSYEQLEAYVDDVLSSLERNSVRAHVHVCAGCAEELRDLEIFRKELQRPGNVQPLKIQAGVQIAHQKSGNTKQRITLMFTLPRAAAGLALAAGLAIAALLWQQHSTQHSQGEAAIQTTTPIIPKASTASSSSSEELAGLNFAGLNSSGLNSEDEQAVRNAIEQHKLAFPATLKDLQGISGTLMSTEQEERHFSLSGPLGEVVPDTHPLFRWQPQSGASSYAVTVLDAGLNAVESSPSLHGTQWKSSRALDRGRIYIWQVTATLGDGTTLISPAPPAPEAKFRVLAQDKANEIERFRQLHPGAHFLLGTLYAQAGRLASAENELKQTPATDSNYKTAQEFLSSIRQLRRGKR